MFPCADAGYGYGWIFPVLMIGMMVLCFALMARRRTGSPMCMPGFWRRDARDETAGSSALDILNRRFASGEIDQREYEEKKRTLNA